MFPAIFLTKLRPAREKYIVENGPTTYLRAWISDPYTSRAESTTRFVLTSLLVLETEQSRFFKFEFAFSGWKIKRLKGI